MHVWALKSGARLASLPAAHPARILSLACFQAHLPPSSPQHARAGGAGG